MKRVPYILIFLVQAALFITVMHDPFFGDAISSTVRAAGNIYDHGLGTIFYPAAHDPGHPTLYAWLLAAAWMLFGKSLVVSHLFSCLWAAGLGIIFIKIARLHLDDNGTIIATLLLLVLPTYLSQSAMMLNTVAFMLFALMAFYGLLSGSRKWQLAGSCLMMITHTQSTFMLLSVALADLVVNYKKEEGLLKWIAHKWFLYTVPFVLYATWLALHYRHTGWLFHSPNYTDVDDLNGIGPFFKSVAVIAWRLLDFGMAPVYIVIAVAVWRRAINRRLVISWFVALWVTALAMAIFLENTIGHRYFLCFGMIALVIAVQYMQQYVAKRFLLFVALWLALFAGNFLYYPGKTLGDGTLAYRSYFSIEKELAAFLPSDSCYSYAPIANEPALTHLADTGFYIRRIRNESLAQYPVVIQSNVNAEFTAEQKQALQGWYGKSFEKGAVYVNVFLNPAFYSKPGNWYLREPSSFEKWMNEVKADLKK